MLKVIADVVSDKRKHRHGIAPENAGFPDGSGSGFGSESGSEIHAVLPISAFADERSHACASAAKENRRKRNPLRIFPFARNGGTLRRRSGEARVRMRPSLW